MAGLTPIELSSVLTGRKFGDRLLETSEFTTDHDLEAGFAVYKNGQGKIDYSAVLHPDAEYLEAMLALEERAQLSPQDRLDILLKSIGGSDDPTGSLPELSLGQLITDGEVRLRADLAIVTHSHPLTHLGRRRPLTFLLPSSSDLINFGDHLPSNPELIVGTTATHKDLGGIALLL